MPKNGFFDLFFLKIACGAENLAKTGSFYCFGRARKINLIDLKKKVVKIFENFFENPPPLEKILDPPLIGECFLGSKLECTVNQEQNFSSTSSSIFITRGGFRGRARNGRPSPSGMRPPADPMGPPFELIRDIHFWLTDPKIFLKAPLAPIYTNSKGDRAPKKRNFLVKIFQKKHKNAFLACFFFKILPAASKLLPKQVFFSALGVLGKSIWST